MEDFGVASDVATVKASNVDPARRVTVSKAANAVIAMISHMHSGISIN